MFELLSEIQRRTSLSPGIHPPPIAPIQHPFSTHPASSTASPLKCLGPASIFGNLFYQSGGSCPSQLDIIRDSAEDSIFSRLNHGCAFNQTRAMVYQSVSMSFAHASRILPIHTQYQRRIDTDRQPSRYPNWLSLNNLVPTVNSISRSGRFCHSAHPLISPHLSADGANP